MYRPFPPLLWYKDTYIVVFPFTPINPSLSPLFRCLPFSMYRPFPQLLWQRYIVVFPFSPINPALSPLFRLIVTQEGILRLTICHTTFPALTRIHLINLIQGYIVVFSFNPSPSHPLQTDCNAGEDSLKSPSLTLISTQQWLWFTLIFFDILWFTFIFTVVDEIWRNIQQKVFPPYHLLAVLADTSIS